MNKISKIVSVVVGLITSVSVVVGVFSSGNNDAGGASSIIAQSESSVVENNGIPYIGANGNWWIGGIDTGESAQQGSSESSANQNTDTNSNKTPNVDLSNNIILNNQTEVNIELQTPQYYIGANGNWWINGKDSGIKATITENKTDTSSKTSSSGKNENNDKADSSSSEKNNSSSTTVYEIGANGNWWINGKDTGIKAPVSSSSNSNNQNTETSSKKPDPVNTSSMVSSQKPESVTTSSQGTSSVEILTDPADIVEAAYNLEPGMSLGYDVTLTGKVVEIKTVYSADYNCISVVIEVEGKKILCYRMTGTAKYIRAVVIGDTITVTGRIKNYNGSVEFDTGCIMRKRVAGSEVVLTDPKEIVDAAFALKPGEYLLYQVALTGKIVKINTPYDAAYKNITVTIEVEGTKETKEIKCFRLKGNGADALKVGDTIAVTGMIKNYLHSSGESEVEFDAGCTFVLK